MPTEPDNPFDRPIFESVVDRRIREATERGEFDDLPGSGKPIADLDAPYDPDWWVKRWVSRERLTDLRRELAEIGKRESVRLAAGLDPEGSAARLEDIENRINAIDDRLAEPDSSGDG